MKAIEAKQCYMCQTTDSHKPSFLSLGDRADRNMQVNEIMFKVQVLHVMIFVCKKNPPHHIVINIPILQKSIKTQYINLSIEPLTSHKLHKKT